MATNERTDQEYRELNIKSTIKVMTQGLVEKSVKPTVIYGTDRDGVGMIAYSKLHLEPHQVCQSLAQALLIACRPTEKPSMAMVDALIKTVSGMDSQETGSIWSMVQEVEE